MTKEEFIQDCIAGGYTNGMHAKLYASKEDKDDFTMDDIIAVYRQRERAMEIAKRDEKFRDIEGHKTTKRLKQSEKMGSDRND